MTKQILGFVIFCLLGSFASAGVLIDPYLGYAVSGNTGAASVSGYDMGLRLGLSNLGLAAGADITLVGNYTYKNNGVSSDAKPLHTGVFVSYTFPVLVRAYGTYFVNSKIADDTTTVTGNGTKIGVQYTGLPLVAVGIELYSMNYSETETAGLKSSTSGSETQTRLAISLPITL